MPPKKSNITARGRKPRTKSFPFDYPRAAVSSAESDYGSSEDPDYGKKGKWRAKAKKSKHIKGKAIAPLPVPDLPAATGSLRPSPVELGDDYVPKDTLNDSTLATSDVNTHELGIRIPSSPREFTFKAPNISDRIVFDIPPGSNQVQVDLHLFQSLFTNAVRFGSSPSNDAAPSLAAPSLSSVSTVDSGTATVKPTATAILREIELEKQARRAQELKENESRPPPFGFCSLPAEIRNKIYGMVLTDPKPVDFYLRSNFEKSSQFLSTCKMVHDEGKLFLYCLNAFHLEKNDESRGMYYEKEWETIGWTDVRKWLESIGSVNISLLRYISIVFADARPMSHHGHPLKKFAFWFDPHLHHCLQMLGHHGQLHKFAMTFWGQRELDHTQALFIRALRTIKSNWVVFVAHPRNGAKHNLPGAMVKSIGKKMARDKTKEEEEELLRNKHKEPVKMYSDFPGVAISDMPW